MTNVTQQFVRAVQAITSAGTPLYKFCSFNEKTPRIWRVFWAQKENALQRYKKEGRLCTSAFRLLQHISKQCLLPKLFNPHTKVQIFFIAANTT